MERIGIYGGAFNPPHIGHIDAARCAADRIGLSKLFMIPTCESPHKQMPKNSPDPQQRLKMLSCAIEKEENFGVSDLELQRGGKSYTWQTVEQIKKQYPGSELILLMGTDMFLSFLSWREPDKILADASIGVMYRGEPGEKESVARQKDILQARGAKVYLVENSAIDISSTELRRLLVFQCAAPFLPAQVNAYIQEHALYGANESYRDLSISDLEQVCADLLNPNRVAHVLGCRKVAVELARLWGEDENAAARAALLHDITKALSGEQQLTLCREYGIIPDNFSSKNLKIIHALTGSYVADRIFGESEAVVSAIRWHTTGKANMNMLEKIVYVADYIEPCRKFDGVDRLRQLAYTDIDEALRLGLTMTIDLLVSQGRAVSQQSIEALTYLDHYKRNP